MAKKGPEAEDLFREDLRYRAWMSLLFWGGMATIALKEWLQGTWEDVAGAWSLWGVLTYWYLKRRPPQGERFPPPLPWWRTVPGYAASGWVVGVTLLRFLAGLKQPPEWADELAARWQLGKEQDWLGIALSIILLVTLITRETCFTAPSSRSS